MADITTENSVIINRPIEEVFDTATCLESCINWWTVAQSARKVTPGPVAIGTEYHHVGKFMGMTMESRPVVSVLDAPHHFAYTSDAEMATMDVDYRCEAVEGGTRLSMKTVSHPKGAAVPEAMLAQMSEAFSRQFQSDMVNLKSMMESGVKVKIT